MMFQILRFSTQIGSSKIWYDFLLVQATSTPVFNKIRLNIWEDIAWYLDVMIGKLIMFQILRFSTQIGSSNCFQDTIWLAISI